MSVEKKIVQGYRIKSHYQWSGGQFRKGAEGRLLEATRLSDFQTLRQLDLTANPRGGTHYPYVADTDMDRHERASNLLEGTQQESQSLPVRSGPLVPGPEPRPLDFQASWVAQMEAV